MSFIFFYIVFALRAGNPLCSAESFVCVFLYVLLHRFCLALFQAFALPFLHRFCVAFYIAFALPPPPRVVAPPFQVATQIFLVLGKYTYVPFTFFYIGCWRCSRVASGLGEGSYPSPHCFRVVASLIWGTLKIFLVIRRKYLPHLCSCTSFSRVVWEFAGSLGGGALQLPILMGLLFLVLSLLFFGAIIFFLC